LRSIEPGNELRALVSGALGDDGDFRPQTAEVRGRYDLSAARAIAGGGGEVTGELGRRAGDQQRQAQLDEIANTSWVMEARHERVRQGVGLGELPYVHLRRPV